MNDDLEHLRLLSIVHYVVGGLAALCGLFPIVHVTLGVLIVSGAFPDTQRADFPRVFGWLFIVMGSCFILVGWAFAVCVLVAGRFLARHTRYTYCLVMAALECCFIPFGTVLGVFTIIVLMRPSVKQLFGYAPLG